MGGWSSPLTAGAEYRNRQQAKGGVQPLNELQIESVTEGMRTARIDAVVLLKRVFTLKEATECCCTGTMGFEPTTVGWLPPHATARS